MTEARVLWFYIRLIVLPTNAQMGLFHDDIATSRGLLEPISTLLSIAGLAALLGLSFLTRKKAPLVTFAVLFFLTGHLLESSVFALEIAYEHRNYLPMYGLLLVLFFYMLYPLRFQENLQIRQVAAVIFIGLFAFSTFVRAGKWSNPFDFAESELAHHPNSPRNNGEMANIYANITTSDQNAMEMHYLSARYHYEKAVSLSPNYTNGLFGLIQLSSSRGKTVEAEWINMLEQRLSESKYAPDTGNQLMGLVTCQSKGVCKLPKNHIERILQAPFKNPGLTGPARALALLAWTHYLINLASDYPAAITALQQAIDASPNDLEYRLTLIQFLVALERDEEAQNQLAILKRLDKMGAYAELAESQEKLLDERSKNLLRSRSEKM
jgi:tetratricopeptide (TPR) repeat protein